MGTMNESATPLGGGAEPLPSERRAAIPLEGVSDRHLMEGLRRDDPRAFEALVNRYKDRVLDFLFRMVGDLSWAEDLTQEAMLKLFEKRREYQERDLFRAWLFRIARNLGLDFLRRRRGRPEVGEGSWLLALADRGGGPGEGLDRVEKRLRIERAIAGLSEKYRRTLVLVDLEGLSYEEAAHVEGTKVKTISTRLVRARRKLVEELGDLVEDPS